MTDRASPFSVLKSIYSPPLPAYHNSIHHPNRRPAISPLLSPSPPKKLHNSIQSIPTYPFPAIFFQRLLFRFGYSREPVLFHSFSIFPWGSGKRNETAAAVHT